MTDLSRPWPAGLGGKRWWITVAGVLALLGAAVLVDHQASVSAQGLPETLRTVIAQFTPYGESA